MFYLDGDNNLDGTYPPIFNQLEAAANSANVNVVVLWDRYGNNNSAYYKVQYDTDLNKLANYISNVNYWPKGELNMGDPQALVDFVNWAHTNFPADHYDLILDNHGSGLGGGMVDDTSGGDRLTVVEIGSALSSVTNGGANKIDVLYMSACLMGMVEDAYQIRNFVNYYVASENIQWAYREPYSQYVSGINATTTPPQLATLFATSYANVGDSKSDPYTMSAADLSKLDSLVTTTNLLSQLLYDQMSTSAATLTSIRSSVQRFEMNGDNTINASDSYIDLYDFARLVKANFSDSNIQTAAQNVMDSVSAYIITERHRSCTLIWPFCKQRWNLDNSHGVSVFFPTTASSFYSATNYDFATGAAWPNAPIRAPRTTRTAIAWGPMLVNYFQTTQPGGPDNPTPPPLLPKAQEIIIYLPFIRK